MAQQLLQGVTDKCTPLAGLAVCLRNSPTCNPAALLSMCSSTLWAEHGSWQCLEAPRRSFYQAQDGHTSTQGWPAEGQYSALCTHCSVYLQD